MAWAHGRCRDPDRFAAVAANESASTTSCQADQAAVFDRRAIDFMIVGVLRVSRG